MTVSEHIDDEIRRLLWAMRDGELTAGDAEKLHSMLHDDPHARELYVWYMFLAGSLEWDRSGFRVQGSGVGEQESEDRNPKSEMFGSESAIADPVPSIPPIIVDLSPTIHPSLFSLQSPLGSFLFSYTTSAILLGIAALIGWAWKLSNDERVVQSTPASVGQVDNPSNAAALPLVARITGMADCQWADPRTAPVGFDRIRLGHKYALASGLMEITYDTGAKVILQGPCTYEVESTTGGYLSLGKLTARVEKKNKVVSGQWSVVSEAQGQEHYPLSTSHYPLFSVRTPTAVVTDLGTEFGVEVSAGGVTDSRVFVGRVAVVPVDKGKTAGEKRRIVRAGQLVRIGRNRNISITDADDTPASEERFVRALSSKEVQEADAYAKMVLALRPAVYYRMEPPTREDHKLVFDSGPSGCHGTLHRINDFGPARVAGRFGGAIFFRGPGVGDYVLVRNYPKAVGDQLTVSAWVMSLNQWHGPTVCPMIAANWGNLREVGQFTFGLQDDNDLYFHVAQRDAADVRVRESPSKPFPLGAWQHVAAVLDKTVLRLYRNGVQVGQVRCDGLLANPRLSSLAIGSKTNDDGETPSGYFWHGRIDELAIFNRALSAGEILRLSGTAIDPRKQESPNLQAGKPQKTEAKN